MNHRKCTYYRAQFQMAHALRFEMNQAQLAASFGELQKQLNAENGKMGTLWTPQTDSGDSKVILFLSTFWTWRAKVMVQI